MLIADIRISRCQIDGVSVPARIVDTGRMSSRPVDGAQPFKSPNAKLLDGPSVLRLARQRPIIEIRIHQLASAP